MEDAVIAAPESGVAQIVVHNRSGFTQCFPRGACLGEGETAQVCSAPGPSESNPHSPGIATVKQTTSGTEAWRKAKLLETMELSDLPPPNSELLQQFLVDHHDVFSLEDGERGETDLVRMEIDTGDTSPKKQAPRRMLFAVRKRWRSS